jgi:hypothetical protein
MSVCNANEGGICKAEFPLKRRIWRDVSDSDIDCSDVES